MNSNHPAFRWILAICLIFAPLTLIHTAAHEAIPRLISIIWFYIGISALGLFLSTRPTNELVIEKAKDRTKSKKWNSEYVAIIVRGLMIAAMLCSIYLLIEPVRGMYRLSVKGESYEIISGTVISQDFPLYGALYLYRGLELEGNRTKLSFIFPNNIKSDKKYTFTVLPGTNLVLDSKPVD